MSNELSTRIDRDRLHMVSRDDAATVAHALLNGARNDRGEHLSAGTAVLFAVMVERTQMDPQELYRLGRRILHEPSPHHRKGNAQLEALRDFAGLRVRNEAIV